MDTVKLNDYDLERFNSTLFLCFILNFILMENVRLNISIWGHITLCKKVLHKNPFLMF